MLFWAAIAYAVSTPFAIWIHFAIPPTECIEEKLRAKASSNFTRVAWMFDGVFAMYHLCWAIIAGPFVVALMAILFAFALVYEFFWGEWDSLW